MSVTILDGGIGQELMRRSPDKPTPLWSTKVMLDHPEILTAVHGDYFAAGAEVATTNTYATHRDRLERFGDPALFDALLSSALDAAVAARDVHGSGRVAGSLGPLVASYRSDVVPPPEVAAPKFAEVAERLAERADLLIAETVVSLDHAEGVLRGASGHGVPVWLSVTVDDEDGTVLRSGEAVADLAPIIDRHGPAAVLVNCSAPEAVTVALETIAGFGVPFGANANGFKEITKAFLDDAPTVDVLSNRPEMTPTLYAGFAATWAEMGATLIGGCCEIGPAHIAEVARRFGK